MSAPGRYVVPALFLTATFYFLYQVHHVLLPFVLAATLAYLLNPLVVFFQVHGVRRRVGVWLVFLVFMAVLVLLTYTVLTLASSQAVRLSLNATQTMARLATLAQAHRGLVERFPALQHMVAREQSAEAMTWIWSHTPRLAMQALPILELTLLVPFLSLFFMLDGLEFREAILGMVPARYVEMLLSVFVEIDNSLGNYLRGLCLESLCMGVSAGLGFWLIGLNYTIQIACWVGVSTVVPFLGPVSAAVIGGAVALVQWGTLGGIMKVFVVCGVIRLIDDACLQPLILRRAVHVHPAILIFALMAGSSIFGFWGLLFAIPGMCMLKVLGEVIWESYTAEYGLRRNALPIEVSHIPLI